MIRYNEIIKGDTTFNNTDKILNVIDKIIKRKKYSIDNMGPLNQTELTHYSKISGYPMVKGSRYSILDDMDEAQSSFVIGYGAKDSGSTVGIAIPDAFSNKGKVFYYGKPYEFGDFTMSINSLEKYLRV